MSIALPPPPPLVDVTALRFAAPGTGRLIRRPGPQILNGMSFRVARGEMLGVVGESGCGKSTLGRLLAGLDRPTAGHVTVGGDDPAPRGRRAYRQSRARLQYVFQDPMSALNPRLTIGYQIAEGLRAHGLAADPGRAALHWLERVGLSAAHAARYPHQLSGGQRQRVVIARALSVDPLFTVFDEPVSALDVSVQAQVLNLLAELRRELGLTGVFISHDLRVVRYVSDRIAVIYLGEIVEIGPADAVFHHPLHPYSRALIGALLSPAPGTARRSRLTGTPPDISAPPPGCRFHPRCPWAMDRCRVEAPAPRPAGDGRQVSCHLDRPPATDAARDRAPQHREVTA
ncbi:ABC transporter ATP-binding protein [Marinibacterium sp. SX1]|uniref:ABC transporter ATP-binding protein n=1 Tax=Marinibacterium sp. SX1 TaxID=3388424 RepID=UPI003D16961B